MTGKCPPPRASLPSGRVASAAQVRILAPVRSRTHDWVDGSDDETEYDTPPDRTGYPAVAPGAARGSPHGDRRLYGSGTGGRARGLRLRRELRQLARRGGAAPCRHRRVRSHRLAPRRSLRSLAHRPPPDLRPCLVPGGGSWCDRSASVFDNRRGSNPAEQTPPGTPPTRRRASRLRRSALEQPSGRGVGPWSLPGHRLQPRLHFVPGPAERALRASGRQRLRGPLGRSPVRVRRPGLPERRCDHDVAEDPGRHDALCGSHREHDRALPAQPRRSAGGFPDLPADAAHHVAGTARPGLAVGCPIRPGPPRGDGRAGERGRGCGRDRPRQPGLHGHVLRRLHRGHAGTGRPPREGRDQPRRRLLDGRADRRRPAHPVPDAQLRPHGGHGRAAVGGKRLPGIVRTGRPHPRGSRLRATGHGGPPRRHPPDHDSGHPARRHQRLPRDPGRTRHRPLAGRGGDHGQIHRDPERPRAGLPGPLREGDRLRLPCRRPGQVSGVDGAGSRRHSASGGSARDGAPRN